MIKLFTATTGALSRLDTLLPLLARLIFAAVLAGYFWASALTKFDGPFTLSTGAFAQIFPKAIEAVGYDASQLPLWMHLFAYAGALAEIVPSRSNSSTAPSLAQRRRRRRAIFRLRVPSSTRSSKSRNSRLSQTLTAR